MSSLRIRRRAEDLLGYDCRCDEPCWPDPCCCPDPCWPNPCGQPPGFMSCYIEAVGDTQALSNGDKVVFDTSDEALDIVGNGIRIDTTGTIFTISRPGLYHVEWSVNTEATEHPTVIGLMEGGYPASALSNSVTSGNISSGALISVAYKDAPVKLSLHNFGGDLTLKSHTSFQNTAVSIRILRFADGADNKPHR